MLEVKCQALLSLQNKGDLYPVDMELKDRIKAARSAVHPKLTQAKVAEELNVTPQAVSGWERGEAEPEADKFLPLARLLQVEVGWLHGGDEGEARQPREADPPAENYRPPPQFLGDRDLKVFASAEGGQGTMVVNTDPIELVPRPWYLGNVKDGYAVLIVGDSMEPVFEAGDMAVVNPRLPPLRNKNVILVARENEGEFVATIKRLMGWTDKEWKLRQFNPRKDFTLLRKEWPKALRVVGKYDGG